MPTANIYKRENLLETKDFEGHFYILSLSPNNKDPIWETDEEQKQSSSRTGTIVIWLKGTLAGYELSFVPTDWHLQVDDMDCEKGSYVDILIKWHKVTLSHNEHTFEFLFDQQGYRNVPLPQPISRQ